MESGGRLRLFVALPLPEEVVERLVRWQREALGAPPGTRLVPPANLHLTLAFLGSRPASDVGGIVEALRVAASSSRAVELEVRGYRETQRVGMLVLADADESGDSALLARRVQDRLAGLGVYEHESRPWTPHVTVLRFRDRPRLAPPLPDLGRIVPSEVALYHSVLRPTGAQYEIRQSVALGAET